MIFQCGNCAFKLVNEFCPKCGQRMAVACDECVGRVDKIAQLEGDLTAAAATCSRIAREWLAKYDRETQALRDGYAHTCRSFAASTTILYSGKDTPSKTRTRNSRGCASLRNPRRISSRPCGRR